MDEIRSILASEHHPPMRRDLPGHRIGAFVSGHTHIPALSEIQHKNGDAAIIVNSGCWLRQLQPVPAHFGGHRFSCQNSCRRTCGSSLVVPLYVWNSGNTRSRRACVSEPQNESGYSATCPRNPPRMPSRGCALGENCEEQSRGASLSSSGAAA